MSKIKLYENFSCLLDSDSIWLYSDPHFNDSESKLLNPNWPTADEIVEKINNKVGKNDALIILGDIGDETYIKKIKSNFKVLIKGNHDKGNTNYIRKIEYKELSLGELLDFRDRENRKDVIEKCKQVPNFVGILENNHLFREPIKYFDNRMFDMVFEGPIFLNEKILLSHEPINIPFGINIHGHNHSTNNSFYEEGIRASVNICSDMVDFEPIRLDKLLEKYKVQTLHRQAIDKAGNK